MTRDLFWSKLPWIIGPKYTFLCQASREGPLPIQGSGQAQHMQTYRRRSSSTGYGGPEDSRLLAVLHRDKVSWDYRRCCVHKWRQKGNAFQLANDALSIYGRQGQYSTRGWNILSGWELRALKPFIRYPVGPYPSKLQQRFPRRSIELELVVGNNGTDTALSVGENTNVGKVFLQSRSFHFMDLEDLFIAEIRSPPVVFSTLFQCCSRR